MPNLEGWIDKLYIRIYDDELIGGLNVSYNVREFIPGYRIIGSSDLGDALCFNESDGKLYWIPFVPLDVSHRQPAFNNLDELKASIMKMKINTPVGDDNYGLEVHYKHPVVLGGDMWDKDNVVFPPRDVHIKLVEYWNRVYYRMKNEAANE